MNNCIYLVCFSECFVGVDIDLEETKAFTSLEKAIAYCDFLNKKFLTDNNFLELDDTSGDEYIVFPIPFEND
jgi:hypothetical protein